MTSPLVNAGGGVSSTALLERRLVTVTDPTQGRAARAVGVYEGYNPRTVAQGESALPIEEKPRRFEGDSTWYRRFRRLLVILDSVVLTAVITGTFSWRMNYPDVFTGTIAPGRYAVIGVVLLFLWIALLGAQGTRRRNCVGVGVVEYQRVVKASLWLFGLVAIFSFIVQMPVARFMFVLTLPMGVVALIAERWVARTVLNRRRQREGRYMTPALLVGPVADIATMVSDIAKVRGAGYRPVAICVTDGTAGRELPPALRQLHRIRLEDVSADLTDDGIGAIMILGGLSKMEIRHISWEMEKSPVEFILQASITDITGPRMSSQAAEALNLVYVDLPKYDGWELVLKRAFDVVFSALALVILSPVLGTVALLIKLSDPSAPVIFRQERIGRDGEPFTIHKFRTMCVDAEDQIDSLINENGGSSLLFKLENDSRITSLGHALRKYSLDELPQFWTVLKGSMSVVGPRPQVQREVDEYTNVHMRRLLIKPGITGLWQVTGRSKLTAEEAIRADLRYVENWSIVTDLLIIVKTLFVVIKGVGAY
jgi:exopolysaccharide biosynthesis polyprenyl glycosylphosphotransferase